MILLLKPRAVDRYGPMTHPNIDFHLLRKFPETHPTRPRLFTVAEEFRDHSLDRSIDNIASL